MPNGEQVRNGKSFEYAIALAYFNYLSEAGYRVDMVEDAPMETARGHFESLPEDARDRFLLAAKASIPTILKLESGFTSPKNDSDILQISLSSDRKGEDGDVRDVVFTRALSNWEVGFSAKNNNDAVKHPRVSNTIDFGAGWLGHPVSHHYWERVRPIFERLTEVGHNVLWEKSGLDKVDIYKPILDAFRDELLRQYQKYKGVPQKLVEYLIGEYPFYKLIKDDDSHMLVVKAYNIHNGLNKTVNDIKPRYSTQRMNLPTRIVEFSYKIKRNGGVSDNTLDLIMDGGWEISFRLHNADKYVEPSLKFDVQLLGNPPVLFTQYLFAE